MVTFRLISQNRLVRVIYPVEGHHHRKTSVHLVFAKYVNVKWARRVKAIFSRMQGQILLIGTVWLLV